MDAEPEADKAVDLVAKAPSREPGWFGTFEEREEFLTEQALPPSDLGNGKKVEVLAGWST
jgi:hypothetical protein